MTSYDDVLVGKQFNIETNDFIFRSRLENWRFTKKLGILIKS
jgi:hypothetical protein